MRFPLAAVYKRYDFYLSAFVALSKRYLFLIYIHIRYINHPPSIIYHPSSTLLAYLDTNALVVETVWVARLGVGFYIHIYIHICGMDAYI
jgi:hypothetical protein